MNNFQECFRTVIRDMYSFYKFVSDEYAKFLAGVSKIEAEGSVSQL